MIFTMPWSATSAFPHPLAGLDPGADQPVQNFLSYGVVDLLIWSGIGDLVNAFRETDAGAAADRRSPTARRCSRITRCRSRTCGRPALCPSRADWGPHIDLANFIFYDQARSATSRRRALLDFLAAGEPPIYVGFGSVVVEDPAALTPHDLRRAREGRRARHRVGGLGAPAAARHPPPNVFLIGDTPHDWLFARCRAVCHHGGAGTTAAGLRAGLADRRGAVLRRSVLLGAGGRRCRRRAEADSDRPARQRRARRGVRDLRRPEVRERAQALGADVRETDGVELAVRSVYRQLPVDAMRCANHSDRLATVECIACGRIRLCPDCAKAHSSHLAVPCRYVDWDVRSTQGLVGGFGDLVGDAARAMLAGLDEIVSRVGS